MTQEHGMKVHGRPMRTIWLAEDGWAVEIIDQTKLPHAFVTVRLESLDDAAHAIRAMLVRGAPLIGATAAYGLALALHRDGSDEALDRAGETLLATRPTAVNLRWAVEDVTRNVQDLPPADRAAAAYGRAADICDEDVEICRAIGRNGLAVIEHRPQRPGGDRADLGGQGPGGPGRPADPLQRRLARHRRLGHGNGAGLHGP
jgi:methylthioribose-1-phosphate isomerase